MALFLYKCATNDFNTEDLECLSHKPSGFILKPLSAKKHITKPQTLNWLLYKGTFV
jgi:hypothetical protein